MLSNYRFLVINFFQNWYYNTNAKLKTVKAGAVKVIKSDC